MHSSAYTAPFRTLKPLIANTQAILCSAHAQRLTAERAQLRLTLSPARLHERCVALHAVPTWSELLLPASRPSLRALGQVQRLRRHSPVYSEPLALPVKSVIHIDGYVLNARVGIEPIIPPLEAALRPTKPGTANPKTTRALA